MKASLAASFLVFVLTGVYAFASTELPFSSTAMAKVLVFATLFLNGCFFFYYEAFTEGDLSLRSQLKAVGLIEWLFRMSAQILLFSLWFNLQFGWNIFTITLVLLYVCYLAWDALTWEVFENHKIALLDLVGASLSVSFFLVISRLAGQGAKNAILIARFKGVPGIDEKAIVDLIGSDPDNMMLLGILMAGYLTIFIVVVFWIRFNPLKDFKNKAW